MSKQNLEMLEEIFKGAKMGMNATKLVAQLAALFPWESSARIAARFD